MQVAKFLMFGRSLNSALPITHAAMPEVPW
jgi:hypothetical protein